MRHSLLLFTLLLSQLSAQIHADFTVSQGGTSLGTFRVLLEHQKAPRTCANFIGLASGKRAWIDSKNAAVRTNTPFYDGLIFHRLIHSFVIQGGANGKDGPGYTILDEYDQTLRHSSAYVLSMAKGPFPNTGSSQFFITLRSATELDDKHSVFGKVISGTDIIDKFKNPGIFPTGAGDKPVTPIVMDSVVISGPDYASFDLAAPSLRLPSVGNTTFIPERNTAASSFLLRFDRRPKTNYFFLQSTDLATWSNPQHLLSLDSFANYQFSYLSITQPKFFVNTATVQYEQIPEAPADLVTGEKTVRIRYPNGSRIDLTLTPDFSVWEYADINGSNLGDGFLSNVLWTDSVPSAGFLADTILQTHRIPLGRLGVTFDSPAGPENLSSLNTQLSFHTETSGWLEEPSGTSRRRLPFELIQP
ncbi:MAG: peptidylprolyl isomerase [Armatimonadetes bacterium]|nr:peptidylprolyl isomerase [Akkermansiaceae bacterium]